MGCLLRRVCHLSGPCVRGLALYGRLLVTCRMVIERGRVWVDLADIGFGFGSFCLTLSRLELGFVSRCHLLMERRLKMVGKGI